MNSIQKVLTNLKDNRWKIVKVIILPFLLYLFCSIAIKAYLIENLEGYLIAKDQLDIMSIFILGIFKKTILAFFILQIMRIFSKLKLTALRLFSYFILSIVYFTFIDAGLTNMVFVLISDKIISPIHQYYFWGFVASCLLLSLFIWVIPAIIIEGKLKIKDFFNQTKWWYPVYILLGIIFSKVILSYFTTNPFLHKTEIGFYVFNFIRALGVFLNAFYLGTLYIFISQRNMK